MDVIEHGLVDNVDEILEQLILRVDSQFFPKMKALNQIYRGPNRLILEGRSRGFAGYRQTGYTQDAENFRIIPILCGSEAR